jgi:hypothetical protein
MPKLEKGEQVIVLMSLDEELRYQGLYSLRRSYQ